MEANKNYGLSFSIIFVFIIISCRDKYEGGEGKLISHQKETVGYVQIVPDSLVYNIINEFLLHENDIYKHCKYLLDRNPIIYTNGDSILISKLDTIFPKEDLLYIQKQYKNGNYFLIDKDRIQNKILVEAKSNSEEFWKEIDNNYECISSLKVPIFNKERNMVIIEVGYGCGMLCGEQGIFIYKKDKNEEWKLYLIVERAIS